MPSMKRNPPELTIGENSRYPEAHLLGVRIVDLPAEAIVAQIDQAIQRRHKSVFQYVNIYALNLAQELPWFREYINQAELAYCDGYGVLLGAWIGGRRLKHRSTPPDWMPQLADLCVQRGYSLYMLGGRTGVAEKAGAQLLRDHPGLRIRGYQHGYFNKSLRSSENEQALRTINAAQAQILIVGMGMPVQERWLMENWSRLNCLVALPVGALLDYLAGERQRAPSWMSQHGLEWLGRLIAEPARLWRRYLIGIPLFMYRVLRQRYLPS